MPEEILTIVKIPLLEIVGAMKEKHVLPSKLTDARIESDNLVLSFSEEQNAVQPQEVPSTSSIISMHSKRKIRRKKNRMKTRGWLVVARITNSKGQKCSIYKPFVDALQDQQLTAEEQERKVESILRANKNKPSEGSITYFLENTLEFLRKKSEENLQIKEGTA